MAEPGLQARLSSAGCCGLPNRATLRLPSRLHRQSPEVIGASCQSVGAGGAGGGGAIGRAGAGAGAAVCCGVTQEPSSSISAPLPDKASVRPSQPRVRGVNEGRERVRRFAFIALVWDQARSHTTPSVGSRLCHVDMPMKIAA